jgi:hypothetical protein
MEVSAPLRPAAPRCDALRSRHNRTEPRAERLLAANNFRVLVEPRPLLGARVALSAWRKDQDAIIAACDEPGNAAGRPVGLYGYLSDTRRALALTQSTRTH